VEQRVEEAQPIPATRAVSLAIVAVGITQLLLKDTSIQAGAVSREAVAAGEWWRLFTAPMLHGGVLHFWMNYGALEGLGRTMETRGPRRYVPLVFLAAALAGGVFSILLPPESQSVGASGGLMGMFGFLAVMAWRRKKHMPDGFLRGLLINVALIGLVGAIAYRFIDNAAHAGGLIAGLLIGMISVPREDAEWVEAPGLRRAAWLAQGAIYVSAALTITLTLLAALG
jgi:membrane associated rhomboid family serine protease